MFIGQYQSVLDNDHSLLIPPQFHGKLSEGAYITRGFEQNLMVMGSEVFQEIYNRVVSLNLADPLARLLLRLILGSASRLEMGESGRISIPQDLAPSAGLELKKDVILVGQGDYFELWAPPHWEKQSAKLADAESNTERFAQLDLASH